MRRLLVTLCALIPINVFGAARYTLPHVGGQDSSPFDIQFGLMNALPESTGLFVLTVGVVALYMGRNRYRI